MIPIEKPKQWAPFFLVIIVSFISFIVITQMDKDNHKYSKITKETLISSVIIDIKRTRGSTGLTLSDNKFYGLIWAENFNYNPSNIEDFVKVGDSLSKLNNTDMIYVYRDSIEYEFQFLHKIQKKTSK